MQVIGRKIAKFLYHTLFSSPKGVGPSEFYEDVWYS